MKSKLQEIFEGLTEHSSDKWQRYFDVYERFLDKYRGDPIVFVEVGVQKGGSLDMWAQYFTHPETKIIGIDIDPECSKLVHSDSRVKVVIGDQGVPEFWNSFLKEYSDIDVFVDDGGHYMNQQILTFNKVFPRIKKNGTFICEDVHTSYMPHNGGGLRDPGTFIEHSKRLIDQLHTSWYNGLDLEIMKDMSSISFFDSMVVVEKLETKEMKRVFPKRFA